jgi:hypothetical protein
VLELSFSKKAEAKPRQIKIGVKSAGAADQKKVEPAKTA